MRTLALLAAAALCVPAQEPAGALYTRSIRPLLEARCSACHNGATRQSGLDVTSREKLLRGGDRGAAVVPGKPQESLLLDYVTHRRQPGMPLGGAKLPAEDVARIEQWIREGAPFDGSAPATAAAPAAGAQRRSDHWSFQPVRRPEVPAVAGAPHPVDAFLARERERNHVAPLGETDRHTLLRRVYLDLTGVPPATSDVRAFLADRSPRAYEAVVDRLLASPRYGERWGRHWMDIWRYSDWYGSGAQVRNSQPHIWRWRDWIVESLNADKGYDRMVMEMLAGDELAPGDAATARATGFLVRNWFLFNRNVWLQDTVEAVTASFLGVTLKCARCHDHKYDPLASEDYYRFRAFFEPHDVRLDRVPGEADLAKAGLPRVYDAAPRDDVQDAAGTFLNPAIFAKTFLFIRGDERNPDKEHPLDPATPPVLGGEPLRIEPVELPLDASYPDARPFVQRDLVEQARERLRQADQRVRDLRRQVDAGPPPAPAGPPVDFERNIKPLLESRCGSCHVARNMRGGFSIGSAQAILNGGARMGPAAIPGESAQSPLVQVLRGERQPRMPLNGPPLEAQAIAAIARWIDSLPRPSAAELTARLRVAEKEAVTAAARLSALEARIRAENACHHAAPGGEAGDNLAAQARQAERRAAAASAEENVLRAQQRLAEALAETPAAEGKIAAARKALEGAAAALSEPKEGYTPLGAQYPKTSTGRRLALARWMASARNPLTARVAVNQIWLRHFGKPLVSTVIDWGRNGRRPTHPELLDWLAAEFMARGWSMKTIHRLLVTSAAYRMQSAAPETGHPNLAADPDNRWYWRMNTRRLEAEAIRDSVLHAAGVLDPAMGGPELNEETDARSRRRSLYFRVTPDAQLEFLKVFDGVDPTNCFVRNESIVPQQALALANSKLSLEHARLLAARLASSPEFVNAAFETVLSRPPTPAESLASTAFLDRQQTLFGTDADGRARARANLVHALFNKNEFVTLR